MSKTIKKWLLLLMSALLVVAVAVGITACNKKNGSQSSDHDHSYSEDWARDESQHWHPSSCGDEATSEKESHKFVVSTTESVSATCTTGGKTVSTCSVCGYTKTETVAATGHKWGTSEHVASTCTTNGYTLVKCTNCGTERKTMAADGSDQATGHHYSEATCTTPSVCADCSAVAQPAKGHSYVLDMENSIEATCYREGVNHYVCENGCGSYYDEDVIKTEHDIIWSDGEKQTVGSSQTCFKVVYTASCSNAEEGCTYSDSREEEVSDHVYTTKVVTAATCSQEGTSELTCKNCNYTTSGSIPVDSNNHTWNNGEEKDGFTVYTCQGCGEIKKTADYTSQTSAAVSSTVIQQATEISLKDASIALDDDAKTALGGKDNITISAESLDSNGVSEALGELSDEDKELIGDGVVYSFTMSDGTDNISTFGDGKVTVRIPYTLDEDDDPNNIIVLYINNGEIEEITATYSNGYAVFETSHFSDYSVTKITPAQRCAKFGHNYTTTTFNPTCVNSGYKLTLCTRCGAHSKTDIPATGHDFTDTVLSQASCTENGQIKYSCSKCDVKYTITEVAYGHSWTLTASLAASCTTVGYETYTCDTCETSYTKELPQTAHNFKITKYEATCTDIGYTHSVCIVCGLVDDDNYVDALGHDKITSTVAATCTEEGYTLTACNRCGEELSRTNIVQPKGHTLVNGVCSVCGEGCSHNFVKTSTVEPTCTVGGYSISTCSNCSTQQKTDITSPKGHSYVDGKCSVCGTLDSSVKDYYLSMLNSFSTFSPMIKYSDVRVVVTDKITHDDVTESESYEGKIFDVIALYVSVKEDGTISGYGNGTVTISRYYNGIGEGIEPDITATESAEFLIQDGFFYAYATISDPSIFSSYTAPTEQTTVYKTSIDYILMSATDGSLTYAKFKEYIKWYYTDFMSIVDSIQSTNDSFIASLVRLVVTNAFDAEEIEGGKVYTVNFDKLSALNDALYNNTIDKCIDGVFGEGSYASIATYLPLLLDLTPSQALKLLANYGIDMDMICDAIDDLSIIVTGQSVNASLYLNTMLSSLVDANGNALTIGDLIYQYSGMEAKDIKDMIAVYAESLKEVTVYDVVYMLTQSFGNGSEVVPNDSENDYYDEDDNYDKSEGTTSTPNEMIPELDEDYEGEDNENGDYGDDEYENSDPVAALHDMVASYIEMGLSMLNEFNLTLSFTAETDGTIKCLTLSIPDEVSTSFGNMSSDSTHEKEESGETIRVEETLSPDMDSSESESFHITVKGTIEIYPNASIAVGNSDIISKVNAALPTFTQKLVTIDESENKTYDEYYDYIVTDEDSTQVRIHTDSKGNITKVVYLSESIHREIATKYHNGSYIHLVTSSYYYCYEYVYTTQYEINISGNAYALSTDTNYCGDWVAYSISGFGTYSDSSSSYYKKISLTTGKTLSQSSLNSSNGGSDSNDDYDYSYSDESTQSIYFYYNTKTGEYSLSSPHDYKVNEAKSSIKCGGFYYYECSCGANYTDSIRHLKDSKELTSYTLLDGKDCENGVKQVTTCSACSEVLYSYTNYYHTNYTQKKIRLSSAYPDCVESIIISTCLCGQSQYVVNNDNFVSQSGYYYVDGMKETIYCKIYSCRASDCNAQYVVCTPTIRDKDCNATEQRCVLYGDITLEQESGHWNYTITYTNKYVIWSSNIGISHVYNSSDTYNNGAISTETRSCIYCGTVDYYATYSYERDNSGYTTSCTVIYYKGGKTSNFITGKKVTAYTYNSSHYVTSEITNTYDYEDGEYKFTGRTSEYTEYNSNNNRTKIQYFVYDSDEVQQSYYVHDYTYSGRYVTKEEYKKYYGSAISDETLTNSYTREYTYDKDGNRTSETYYSWDLKCNITYKDNVIIIGDLDSFVEGVDYVINYYYTREYSYKNTYVYVNGERYTFINYDQLIHKTLDGEIFYQNIDEYTYDGTKYCTYTLHHLYMSDGTIWTDETTNHALHKQQGYTTYPTCTQNGTAVCIFCNTLKTITGSRLTHNFISVDDKYVCEYCGLTNSHDYNDKAVLEDLSYKNATDATPAYTIGYYFPSAIFPSATNNNYYEDYDSYTLYAYIVDKDNDKEAADPIYSYELSRNYGTFTITRYELERALTTAITKGEFSADTHFAIRVYAIDNYVIDSYVASITIDIHNWVSGTLAYRTYVNGVSEVKEQSVMYCTECYQLSSDAFTDEYRYCVWSKWSIDDEGHIIYNCKFHKHYLIATSDEPVETTSSLIGNETYTKIAENFVGQFESDDDNDVATYDFSDWNFTLTITSINDDEAFITFSVDYANKQLIYNGSEFDGPVYVDSEVIDQENEDVAYEEKLTFDGSLLFLYNYMLKEYFTDLEDYDFYNYQYNEEYGTYYISDGSYDEAYVILEFEDDKLVHALYKNANYYISISNYGTTSVEKPETESSESDD